MLGSHVGWLAVGLAVGLAAAQVLLLLLLLLQVLKGDGKVRLFDGIYSEVCLSLRL